jgi:nitric oxide dioxygenase
MTPEQKALVQQSWKQVVPMADEVAVTFYRRLFEIDPSVVPLFQNVDLPKQRNKLLQVLAVVVSGLDNPDKLLPVVRDLGRRHASYGIAAQHYDSVGAALLWSLEQGLGEAWTPDVAEAWSNAYTLLAGEMRPMSCAA